jgi:hypothetical protein
VKKAKKYTAVVDLFYVQEATATFSITAESNELAIEKLLSILKSNSIKYEADSFDDIEKPFNISGNFTIALGDDIPEDENDKKIIAFHQAFDSES